MFLKLKDNTLINSLFPAHCAFCGKTSTEKSGICKSCAITLPFIEGDICNSCGSKKTDCGCNGKSHYYTAFCAPMYYNDDSKSGVIRIKRFRKLSGIDTIARLTYAAINDRFFDIDFDYMTCTPMTFSEYNLRGFNQAELIGKRIADNLNIPFKADVISKIYDTKPQKELKFYERMGNVSGVFHISNPNLVKGKTVLLFDDVVTTGATLNECAKMLTIYGAEKVYACSVLVKKSKYDK